MQVQVARRGSWHLTKYEYERKTHLEETTGLRSIKRGLAGALRNFCQEPTRLDLSNSSAWCRGACQFAQLVMLVRDLAAAGLLLVFLHWSSWSVGPCKMIAAAQVPANVAWCRSSAGHIFSILLQNRESQRRCPWKGKHFGRTQPVSTVPHREQMRLGLATCDERECSERKASLAKRKVGSTVG